CPKLSLRVQRGIDCGEVISRKKPSLQFPDPVPALEFRQGRIAGQIPLKVMLVELSIVEGSKFRSQTAKGPHQAELRFDVVDDETEPNFSCEVEAILGLTLHVNQWISCC